MFLRDSTLSVLCMPLEGKIATSLQRPQRGLRRLDWEDTAETEFQMGHADLFHVLRDSGFELVDLVEVFAPAGATDHQYYGYVTADWAKQWPAEEIWRARKR